MMSSIEPPVLQLTNLTAVFPLKRGIVRAVTNVDLTLAQGEILGLVGESGCGKSATMLSILRLLPYPGRIVAGQISLHGQNILAYSSREMRRVRGKSIAMIFQDPMSTLNPAYPIDEQIGESMRIHGVNVQRDDRLPWPFDFARRARARTRNDIVGGSWYPQTRRDAAALSPRTFGRDAAARVDCDRALLRA